MPTVSEAFTLAFEYQRQGNLRQAQQLYLQILQADPRHFQSHHMLGALLQSQGRPEEAVVHYREALQLKPDSAETLNNLGIALTDLGRLDDAVACYRQALSIKPNFAEAHNGLGYALERQNQFEEAIACYRQALQLKPDFAAAYYNLGNAARQQHNLDEAIRYYGLALQLWPDYADAHNNLANVLVQQQKLTEAASSYRHVLRLRPHDARAQSNLGVVLHHLGCADQAVVHHREAVRLEPDYAAAHQNLGTALRDLGQLPEAVQSFRRTVQLKPEDGAAYNHLGTALWDLGMMDEAQGCFEQAVRLAPEDVDAHCHLASVLWDNGQADEAFASLERALRLQPDLPKAHLYRAYWWLQSGRFEESWPEHEWRWALTWLVRKPLLPGMGNTPGGGLGPPELARRKFREPLWDGSDLQGRTILVYAEQGFGDTLHFIRYAPIVQARGGKVIVECQAPLVRLLAGWAGIDGVVAQETPLPEFDVQAPLMSLPGIFHTSLATIPAQVPYLQADASLVEMWRKQLAHLPGFKIGIVWQGNPHHRRDLQRSIPLTALAPLAQREGVQLISLQKGPAADQLPTLASRRPIVDVAGRLEDFMDTAAVMKNLDLIITCDTAAAHLAGALALPVWVALPKAAEWRWLLKREDSPWYPTMRLFRQRQRGCWREVFERMAKELDLCKKS